jgi:dTDP-4-dehydrorhamnose 3,5-epimerase
MEIRESFIKGLFEITPRLFKDERGFFFESFNKKTLEKVGITQEFVQDNQSFSVKGVIRGLHFQRPPYSQAKLVRVVKGKALDVAVDLRRNSTTFGQYDSVVLDAEKNNMFFVPEGFAHGFAALEDTVLLYKCTNFYNKDSESGIRYDDPELKINWEVKEPIISEKDLILKYMSELVQASEV